MQPYNNEVIFIIFILINAAFKKTKKLCVGLLHFIYRASRII